MHRNKLLFLLLFTFTTLHIYAQQGFNNNIHYIYSDQQEFINAERILVYVDSTNSLTIDDIRELQAQNFAALNDIELQDKSATFWAYFKLYNQLDNDLELVLKGGLNAQETYYLSDGANITDTKKTGHHFPVNSRDIKKGHQTRIKISIPARDVIHVYVKITSIGNTPVDIKAELIPALEWNSVFERQKLFQGIFTGVLLIFVIVSFFIYGFTKERVFLFFGLYSLINAIYFLHLHGIIEFYLLPGLVNPLPFLWLFPLLSAAVYFTFTRHFLETKTELPKWNKILKVLSWAALMLFLATSVYLMVSKDFYYSMIVTRIGLSILVLIGSVFVVKSAFSKNIISNYYAYGTMLFAVSISVVIFKQLTAPSHDLPIITLVGILM
mgnify:CR=1 FL=1